MEYGLIGFPLKHSFSKEVHSLFSNYKYDICELEEQSFDTFMKEKNFKGINVTIPYKQKVIPYLDEISTFAKEIYAVNTIVNDNGILKGYNTDFRGVIASFEYFNCFDKNYNYLILGTGATSNTIDYSLRQLGAKNIKKAYRSNSKIKGDILYEELDKCSEQFDFIINTTPNGMYPHIGDELLVDLKGFKNLKGVMDVIYNPLKTKLLIEAEKLGIKTYSGLYMLVSQALFAYKLFSNQSEIKDDYYKRCLLSKQNIVLIGMPTCGKSTLGKMISEKYGYEYIDTDKLIEEKIKMPISEFINSNGEDKFREIESEVIKEISVKNHYVISTGGGAILRNKNVDYLKHNGKLFFINRSLNLLKPSESRPLTSNIDALTKKFSERLPIYKKACDVEINGDNEFEPKIKQIMENCP